ncbi:beta-ketothiolase BktB [Spiribacter insolitus]|uniref:Beta-ketothiolase BktB n=1 Tax=Spiribacter insolitus TaxID=3122417 RepID=A0ABV3T5C5_9GAMM
MTGQQDVVIVGGARTPIGEFGGGLKDVPPTQLAATVLGESVKRAGVAPDQVSQVVFGNVIHTEPRDMYLSRVAAIEGGLPDSACALTLNRLCGSGLQAIVTAASYIRLGEAEAVVGGGAECMSRAPYWLPTARWGQRMGDGGMVDAMVGALTDPFDRCHMGITAENVAEKWGISREEQDALALASHQRAVAAIEAGRFIEQIVPVSIKTRKGEVVFDTDEGPRADVTAERLGAMRPVFKREGGTVTAGNASSINDGAAAVTMMSARAAEQSGITPLARLVGSSLAAVDPKYMGIGPVPAISQLLEQTGVNADDIDVWEINEAFAAQALAVVKDLELDPVRVNPNGSGVSLGHPIGATGANLTVKALAELQRTGGRYGVISMCIGGGQGIAALIERV